MFRGLFKKALFSLLIIAAAGFLLKIGVDNYEDIEGKLHELNLYRVVLAVVFCTTMLVLKGMLHVALIHDFDINKTHWRHIINSYGQAQIIRYIPGKVWGVIFQGEKLEKFLSRKIVWIVNIWQVLITNFNGLGVIAFFLLFYYFGFHPLIFVAFSTIIITYFIFSSNTIGWFISYLSKLKYIDLSSLPAVLGQSPSKAFVKILLLELEWVFYFLFWIWLLPMNTSISDSLILGSIYAGAALVGIIVFVVPSGWFVREASFIWVGLNLGYSEDILFIFGVLARLVMIAGDVLCALILSTISISLDDEYKAS